MALMKSNLSIIIVTFNSYPDIKICLDSIEKYMINMDYEIVLIDNNSSDHELLSYLENLKKIKVIFSDKNLGFGRANNLAFTYTKYSNILILNPDVYFDDNSSEYIQIMTNSLKLNIGAVAPGLIKPNGLRDKNYHIEFNIIKLMWKRLTKIFNSNMPIKNESINSVETVAGAFILIKRNIFQLIKGFDERYFMHSEDLDFSFKIKSYGLKILLFDDFIFTHNVGSSSKKVRFKMLFHMYKSFIQLMYKWYVLKIFKYVFLAIFTLPLFIIELSIRLIAKNKNVSD